jgi:hypothetical protein
MAVAVSAVAVTLLFTGLPLVAQESGAKKAAAKPSSGAAGSTRRVPAYFGQLGLSETQRESIYKIQGKHMPRIDGLEKQLATLRAQMIEECEGVLTSAQKKMLEQRRESAAAARAKRNAPGKSGD